MRARPRHPDTRHQFAATLEIATVIEIPMLSRSGIL
jgi:hypothetical protein